MKSAEKIHKELEQLFPDKNSRSVMIEMIDSLPSIILLLNEDFEILYTNELTRKKFNFTSIEEIFHMQPGDILKCINSDISPDGCGHSSACKYCGAQNTLRESRQSRQKVIKECRILSQEEHNIISYNIKFSSSPFITDTGIYFIVFIEDISSLKRKMELERIFYHDVLNSLNGIQGVVQLLKLGESMNDNFLEIISGSYTNLYRTIKEQQEFSKAETGTLKVQQDIINSKKFIEQLCLPYKSSGLSCQLIKIKENIVSLDFISDASLLSRIIINMIRNAMESSEEKDLITISAITENNAITFSVNNPDSISIENRHHIFERYFTTKGEGRGLGTYSMKLFGETYLKGKVWFTSDEESGTTFYIRLPLNTAD